MNFIRKGRGICLENWVCDEVMDVWGYWRGQQQSQAPDGQSLREYSRVSPEGRYIVLSRLQRGMDWVIGFTDHLHATLWTTSNYGASANLRKSQITTAPAKHFPACWVFISLSLTTASISADSSISRAAHAELSTVNSTIAPSCLSLHCRTQLNSLSSLLSNLSSWPGVLVIQPRDGPNRKHCF
jgi:hypothetical protein